MKTEKIITSAEKIFQKNENLFQDTHSDDLSDFADLYTKIPEFEKLDGEYYKIDASETDIFAHFIKKFPENFMKIT